MHFVELYDFFRVEDGRCAEHWDISKRFHPQSVEDPEREVLASRRGGNQVCPLFAASDPVAQMIQVHY
jgi:hypothetical protein